MRAGLYSYDDIRGGGGGWSAVFVVKTFRCDWIDFVPAWLEGIHEKCRCHGPLRWASLPQRVGVWKKKKLYPMSMPPYPHGLILPPTAHPLAIGAPIHREYLIAMPRQILLQFPRAHLPHFQRGVLAAADEEPAVRGEGGHVDGPDVAAEGGDEGAVAGVPELDVVVPAAGGEGEAVGGEGHVVDLFLVAEEAGERFGGRGGGPEVDCEVVACGDDFLDEGVVDRCG